ncbi:MAG: cobalamin biosynthesis protein CobD [Candidatus Omnitrophica bacterium]|nr:cobalamin biosynthesis protein CobD [Candidatus Omnitrophota bacterium]
MSAIILAFVLDLILGDPVYPYHPVRLMGKAIERLENFLRSTVRNLRQGGMILAFLFPLFVLVLSWWFIYWLGQIHFLLGWAASIFGIYSSLSIRDLHREALQIYKNLLKKDVESARRNLARIVGRDTQELPEAEILRGTVEAVSESVLDGIVAPLFFAALGGAPLALWYKAVNTLDSIIGHQNEKYREFGFFAAKQDTWANLIPAWISYYAIALGALFVNGRFREALFVGWNDGMSASYGPSAIPQATFAGAFGVKLGGVNYYQGVKIEKPYLGFAKKNLRLEDVTKSLKLMLAASWISLLFALLLRYATSLCLQPIF